MKLGSKIKQKKRNIVLWKIYNEVVCLVALLNETEYRDLNFKFSSFTIALKKMDCVFHPPYKK